jgi:cellobiose phosphorylase
MALACKAADRARSPLRCAEHQFPEGDVQHCGIRRLARCAHALLGRLPWLPLAVCYVRAGDESVLDENAYFLAGRTLNADEESYYDLPWKSSEVATLYEHCARNRHGLRFGQHGPP